MHWSESSLGICWIVTNATERTMKTDQTALMRRLIWAFICRICQKVRFLTSRLLYMMLNAGKGTLYHIRARKDLIRLRKCPSFPFRESFDTVDYRPSEKVLIMRETKTDFGVRFLHKHKGPFPVLNTMYVIICKSGPRACSVCSAPFRFSLSNYATFENVRRCFGS